MATVFLCSPTNSTMFTTCCEVAICDDQANCPRCGVEIWPRSRTSRWETAYGPIRRGSRWYGNHSSNDGRTPEVAAGRARRDPKPVTPPPP